MIKLIRQILGLCPQHKYIILERKEELVLRSRDQQQIARKIMYVQQCEYCGKLKNHETVIDSSLYDDY